ncbi:hypothetical protein PIB30_020031 [Stylosanthes scabra]|uniref:Uncharacterized protein n=1 Tax=Stylosanthes scabra TaxID=79078 RepID=A0ABU6R8P7_9FABA|nr:hypothetical protein [Stylosanthes scabra]
MEDLSMFQRPRIVALEYEKPETYGTVLIYPLNRLVECGFAGYMSVNPWVDVMRMHLGLFFDTDFTIRNSASIPNRASNTTVSGYRSMRIDGISNIVLLGPLFLVETIPTSPWYYLYDSVHLPRSERIKLLAPLPGNN